jgi:hypothetical protein
MRSNTLFGLYGGLMAQITKEKAIAFGEHYTQISSQINIAKDYMLLLIVSLFSVCTRAPHIQHSENQNTVENVSIVRYTEQSTSNADAHATQITKPIAMLESQNTKQSVAIYMAGTEPPTLKGVYKVIGSELAKALTGSNAYSAVDRTEDALKIIEKEHIYQRSGAVDEKQIKELGKQLGVKFLCIAEVNEVMDSYFLDARLVDVETAVVVNVVSKPSAMKDVYQVVEMAKESALELVSGQKK